jgi:CHASE2 domain-containing sensor protein
MRSHLFALSALLALVSGVVLADETPAAPRVVVVGVDAKTLEALGPWGGRYRPHHLKLIQQLDKAGVRGIAFDIYLPENPDFAAATREIARAARTSKAPVVFARHDQEPNAAVLTTARVNEGNVSVTRALDIKQVDGGLEATVLDMAMPASVHGLRPLGVELAVRSGVLTAAQADALAETLTVGYENGAPVTMKGYRPHSGDPANVTTVSYVDVLEGRIDPKVLDGALVFVGMHDGQNDVHPHPITGADTSGVHFHAFAMQRFAAFAAEEARKKAEAARQADAAKAGLSETPGLVGGLRQK